MKNLYIAINTEKGGKSYAYVLKTSDSNNLVPVLAGIDGLQSANVWPKNVCDKAVAEWNRIYKEEGRSLY